MTLILRRFSAGAGLKDWICSAGPNGEYIWDRICRRVGVDGDQDFPHLGTGAYAHVFDLKDGRVLKITDDASDAKASLYFKWNPHPTIVKIYKVFRLGNSDFYCVVAQKLKSDREALDKFRYPLGFRVSFSCPEDALDHFKDCSKERKERAKKEINWLKRLHKMQKDTGFMSYDLHDKNLLIGPRGFPRISDLGCSRHSKFSKKYRMPILKIKEVK